MVDTFLVEMGQLYFCYSFGVQKGQNYWSSLQGSH